MQEMAKEYDRILFQFNEVIEKLVPRDEKSRPNY